MFLVGYMNAYLSQSVYFIGQHKGMNQVKYTSAILLIYGKKNGVWWAIFFRLVEA
jgi:hypothetical protein